MKKSLPDWYKAGWLVKHQTTAREIADLLALSERDIKSAGSPGLSSDWKHNIAYNAALGCAAAALAASGYRSSRLQHHYRLIHSLPLTLGVKAGSITRRLEVARMKRHMGVYERAGVISVGEAEELMSLARDLKAGVERWLKSRHPDLL